MTYPMFTVLTPEPGTPRLSVHAEGLDGDTAPHTPWAFFAISGTPGENLCDDAVLEEARKLGVEIDYPLAIETVDAYKGADAQEWHLAGEARYVPAAVAAGYAIIKLPDQVGSRYFRWYRVKQ
jgi:hypothetical protein